MLVILYSFRPTTIQDSQTLVGALQDMQNYRNPYDDPYFLNGFVIAIPYNLIYSILGELLFIKFYVLANLIFLSFVIIDVIPKTVNRNQRFLIATLILLTSPVRAMVDSVQHSGVILGTIYLFLKLQNHSETPGLRVKKIVDWLLPLLLVVPFELKPQLVIPVLLVLLIRKSSQKLFYKFFGYEVFLHASISMYFKMPLDYFWLMRLSDRSSETTMDNTRENSIWSLVGAYFGHHTFLLFLSFFVYFVLLLVGGYFFRGKRISVPLYLTTSMFPILLSYVHTYDFVIISVLLGFLLGSQSNQIGREFLLLLLLLPTIQPSILKVAVVVAIYLSFQLLRNPRIQIGLALEIILAILFYFGLYYFIDEPAIQVNVLLSAVTILGWWLLIRYLPRPNLDSRELDLELE